ncbi:endonuclease domain-containing protein [Notoacmeibacter marinus]|uniref:endonuclease domain-containing protein n=1 Tax=Notoacmeibacter marinus TaxID=1876515 RepID=UPI000DF3B7E1|nr:DUF559 domain-containing protein [Notoacmeibacter marinus]
MSQLDEGPAATRKAAVNFARAMRAQPTDAEHLLWFELRNRTFHGYKFTRQTPIGPYVADFVCRSKRLVVELDGSQHADSAHDDARTRWLNDQGYGVVRFWNDEIISEREAVLQSVLAILEERIGGPESSLRYSPAVTAEISTR